VVKKVLDFSLVLACYNERQIFWDSFSQITNVLDRSRLRYEILFIDDKSPDNTAALVKSACKKRPDVCKGFYHTTNKRRGATVAEGIRESRGKVVGFIDIDCEVSPVYIPEAVQLILDRDADEVVGYRIYRSSVSGIVREAVSVGYKAIAGKLLGTTGIDSESGYKFFLRKKILPILDLADNPHWFWDTQIVVYSLRKGLKVSSLPVLFLRKVEKTSTVKVFSDSVDYLINVWSFFWRLRRESL
jgi:glycosyltransferase AglD